MGGALSEETIPRLRCRVVCGGANNPLATDEDADRLRRRGILYVPDFLANAGAVIDGGGASVLDVTSTGDVVLDAVTITGGSGAAGPFFFI